MVKIEAKFDSLINILNQIQSDLHRSRIDINTLIGTIIGAVLAAIFGIISSMFLEWKRSNKELKIVKNIVAMELIYARRYFEDIKYNKDTDQDRGIKIEQIIFDLPTNDILPNNSLIKYDYILSNHLDETWMARIKDAYYLYEQIDKIKNKAFDYHVQYCIDPDNNYLKEALLQIKNMYWNLYYSKETKIINEYADKAIQILRKNK